MNEPLTEWLDTTIGRVLASTVCDPTPARYPYAYAAAFLTEHAKAFGLQRGDMFSDAGVHRWLLRRLGTSAGGPTHAAAAVALAEAHRQQHGWSHDQETEARRDRVLAAAAAHIPYAPGSSITHRLPSGQDQLGRVDTCVPAGDDTFTVTFYAGASSGPRYPFEVAVDADGIGETVRPRGDEPLPN